MTQIKTIISYLKAYHAGKKIDEENTRDHVLFGDVNQECTGVCTTTWASVDVIKKAVDMNANLIISHEALFWNHGDHRDWLDASGNNTYRQKVALLSKHHIVVWRDHDHVHQGGIPTKQGYVDGIFYGVAHYLGWLNYVVDGDGDNGRYRSNRIRQFEVPETTTREVGKKLLSVGHLNGAKIYGSTDTPIRKIIIPGHNLGAANDLITKIENENINLILGMEVIDFTLAEYVRDSSMIGNSRSILTVGHFNLEELGMRYMAETYLPTIVGEEIPCRFISSGDMYHYLS